LRLRALSYQSDIQDAQRVYKDILNGYSFFTYKSQKVYIKHLTDIDHGWIQEYRKECLQEAKSRGVQTEKQQIETAIEQGLWSKQKENYILLAKQEINNLKESQSKLKLKSQKKNLEKNIERKKKELIKIEEEREGLINVTCESYSDKKVNERYLFYTCFKDVNLKENLFTEEEFEYLEPHELGDLVIENNKSLSELDSVSIKKIAACPFFLNNLMLCKTSPIIFFGKPIIELTNYQTELFSTGLRWKNVLETSKDSPPTVQSLDEMVKWYEKSVSQQNSEGAKEIHSNARGVASSIVGANQEELQEMAGEANLPGISLHEEAKKLGLGKEKRFLDMNDMMKIHGEV